MKKFILAAALAAFAAPALASDDVEGHCAAYIAANGGDSSGCGCLGEAAADDAALAEAILAIATPEDLAASDEATKEAIRACFPDSGV